MFKHTSSSQKSTIGRAIIKSTLFTLSRAVPGPASRLAATVFRTPPRWQPSSRLLSWAETATETAIPFGEGSLPAWVWGEECLDTVLLVHGWAGKGLQLGAFVQPLLERGLRVVAFDGPGHGGSPGRKSSLPELASGIQAAVKWSGARAIVAHSLGATAAMLAVTGSLLDVDRLVLIAPCGHLAEVRRRFSEATGFSPEVVERMRQHFEKLLAFDWDASEPLELAPRIATPTLVIHDQDDREIPHVEGKALADAFPKGWIMSTTGLGHRRILREPSVLAATAHFVCQAE